MTSSEEDALSIYVVMGRDACDTNPLGFDPDREIS
jgi:hypothetical protein